MPEYIVVCCFNQSCGLFQTIQKPKSNKWICRVCQSKQSVIKSYAISYKASDLRPIVQKYNLQKGQAKELQLDSNSSSTFENLIINDSKNEESFEENEEIKNMEKKTSKWDQFVDIQDEEKVKLKKYFLF